MVNTVSRIVVDARSLGTSTGVYVENLLNHLQRIDTDNKYIVVLAARMIGKWIPSNPNFSVVASPYREYRLGEQLGFAWQLARLRPDLVHFCMPQQPLLYFGKRVTTVHDLTLVRYENVDMNPVIYKLRKWIFIALLRNVIWRSKAIITPTDYVRNDIMDFTSRKNGKKIIKTLEAGDPLAATAEPIDALIGKRFITFIGNAFPYKNLPTIVDAFALVQKKYPDLQLAFAGKKEYFYEQLAKYIEQKGVSKDTHILGFVSEGEKRWMLQNAECYIVASLSEGFHIPGLEAMYERCPVISSSATCLPEVYEDAALYFDPHSPQELADHIERLLADKKLHDDLITAGNKQVRKYSWERMARQTYDVYMRVLGS
jgi:glycosyltransferase involved in cell wall biosynthesis